VILISSAALHTIATHAIDVKTIQYVASFFSLKLWQAQAVAGVNLK
jgi:hypothetical protein